MAMKAAGACLLDADHVGPCEWRPNVVLAVGVDALRLAVVCEGLGSLLFLVRALTRG